MNIEEIQENIHRLENEPTTFTNCQKLASLYICKEQLKPGLKRMVNDVNKELNDVLPQYSHYIEVRRQYQLHKTGKKELLTVLGCLCQEISEFLEALYSSTESKEEQDLIKNLKFFKNMLTLE